MERGLSDPLVPHTTNNHFQVAIQIRVVLHIKHAQEEDGKNHNRL